MDTTVYELKVSLRGTKPPIWRRVRVPSNVTLSKLHDILQVAMGWTDSHLHQFILGSNYYGVPDPDSFSELRNEKSVRLHHLLKRTKQKLLYEYDFGDGWLHEVLLERQLDPEPGWKYPCVVKGSRACPPEDCGGPHGYSRLLQVINNPNDPECEEMLEWLGGEFDSESFELAETNKVLGGGYRKSGKRG